MHAAALAATSQQLDALINDGMEESEKRCAQIKDVRVDDFIRFCEYAYRGDYTVPPWKDIPIPTSEELQQNDNSGGWPDGWPSSQMTGKRKKAKKGLIVRRLPAGELEYPPEESLETPPEPPPPPEVWPISRTQLRTEFSNRIFLSDSYPRAEILQHFEPGSNSTMYQDFTPVLLAHARLYSFAHVRLITPLKALTLGKLHKTLLNFKMYAERVGDVIELARYAYSSSDLPDRSDDGTIDDLRKLVLDYIVCEIDTIGKYDGFVKYMEEGGEFVGDFWRLARGFVA